MKKFGTSSGRENNGYDLSDLQLIAGLNQAPTSIVLTASNMAFIAHQLMELQAQGGENGEGVLMDPARQPTPQNFGELVVHGGKHPLRVVNSRTEDKAKCDQVNRIFEANARFLWARNTYCQRKGEKKQVEAIQAESTHEPDPELLKERQRFEEIRRGLGTKTFV